MPSVYLYLSKAKIEPLLEQNPGFWSGVTASLEFKLPFVSGGLSGTNTDSLLTKIDRLEKKLKREYKIPNHYEIPAGTVPVFVSFKGRAVRKIDESQLWIAIDHDHSPLLLAGSASFALGEKPKDQAEISSSADPVGAFVRAFKQEQKNTLESAADDFAISFIWEALVRNPYKSHARLPMVEGLAVYATSFDVTGNPASVRRPFVKEIVVGTPLFVRQCQENSPNDESNVEQQHLVEQRRRSLVEVLSVYIYKAGLEPKKLESLVYKLYTLGYRVSDGRVCNGAVYLTEYKKRGRWNRAFVLYRPEKYELAAEIAGHIEEQSKIAVELLPIEEAVRDNGPKNEDLVRPDEGGREPDVAIAVCFE